jgi:hypothetical protein
MAVRDDCRHYLQRSTPTGEVVQRCRLAANLDGPFACPADCLFFEDRALSGAGWAQAPAEPMSNTADALNALPPPRRKKPKRKRG